MLAVHYSDNERLLPQSSGDAAGVNAASRELRDRLIAVHKPRLHCGSARFVTEYYFVSKRVLCVLCVSAVKLLLHGRMSR
jgi:hypothetical protein